MGEERIGGVKDGQQSVDTPIIPVAIPAIPKPKIALPPTMVSKDIPNPTTAPRAWNTSKLGLRVAADALSAGAAGALVAPIITMIDKGIIENASGRNTLGDSLKQSARELMLRPHRFIGSKPFALIFVRPTSTSVPTHQANCVCTQSLYFGTYFTANTIDTISSTTNSTQPSATTAGPTKFLATSTTNLALCLYKDNKFTQLFGSTSTRPVPLPTFALFTIRDCLTIFASFNLPPLLAPKFEEHMSESVKAYIGGVSAAQFVAPAAVQIVSTPLHLLGLDLYNRPGVGGGERLSMVLGNWAISAAARICRIVPAFGVGGVVNMRVRKGMMGGLEE